LDNGMHDQPASRAAPQQDDSQDVVVRLSVNVSPAVAETIKGIAKRNGISVTEAVRRAISVLAYIDSAQSRGASINIQEDGVLKEVLFFV
jgi:hypothetical protein